MRYPTVMEFRLAQWLIEDGAHVNTGDILCIIESEKATQELQAFETGILRHLKKEGEIIASLNDPPCRIDPPVR
jgi:pyruvate/2-oxoglutarate dehydrogenase complex dihydrolipoamide acyltransferase (E2) component